jgi:rubrerythrin
MNLQQALKVALDFENKVRDHYANGAKAIDDPQGKKVFETLAREEQSHVDYLNHCLREWSKSGKISPVAMKQVVQPGIDWIERARKKIQDRPGKRAASANEIDLLKVALDLELKTSDAYRELVRELPPDEARLFDGFLDIEEGHVKIVQAELDSVQGMGFWFDVMEFQLEAG